MKKTICVITLIVLFFLNSCSKQENISPQENNIDDELKKKDYLDKLLDSDIQPEDYQTEKFSIAGLFAQQTDTQSKSNTWGVTQQGIATQEMQDIGLSAAHSRLAIGSKVRVTNVRNSKEVEVTITRNVPLRADRVIDLSPEAAQAIDFCFGDFVLISSMSHAIFALRCQAPFLSLIKKKKLLSGI